jgi:hypothetical protein
MKTRLLITLIVCFIAMANTFGANRYWVGGAVGTWEATSSWSETAGGASGATAPTTGDDVFFENGAPAVSNADTVVVNSITFTNCNAVITGGFLFNITNLTLNNSQISFKNNVDVVSSLTFSGTTSTITHSGLSSSAIYRFQLGTGGAFTLTGNTTANYFDTTGNSSFRYNTSSDLTVFFKPTTTSSLSGVNVDKGLITLGSNIGSARLNFPPTSLNNQELILAPNVTFTLNKGGSTGFTELPNGGTVNASASGSKFVMKSEHANALDGTKRIFKTGVVINHLEYNTAATTSPLNTFVLFEPIKVRTLSLTKGTIDNSKNSITLEAGGNVIAGAGSTTAPVISGAPTTRYWVGGSAGYWSSAANWGTASGSLTTPGLPAYGDNIVFDNSAGNESPTITLADNVSANSITFTNSNVTFAGAYAITTFTMTVTNSQPTFVDHVTVNSALTLEGSSFITQKSAASGRAFKMGNGSAFTLTGSSPANYLTGNSNAYFTFDTTNPLTVYFNPSTITAGCIVVTKGLITLGSNVNTNRLTLSSTNNQELILGNDVTLTLTAAGTTTLTDLANGGVINASAAGSKVVIASAAPTILNAGTKRIFKDATTINHLEMNSNGQILALGYPLTIKYLTLTDGVINNSTNNITIATAGKITTTNGATIAAVIPGLPGEPINVVATANNAKASVSFGAPEGDGGTAILDYTVIASPGGFSATGSESPIDVTGLTNGVAYTFTVKAANNIGESILSKPSNAITPALNSAIQSVTDNHSGIFSLKNDVISINFNADKGGKAIFKLINLNGQVLLAQNFSIVAGKNSNTIQLGNLPAGIYMVSLTDGSNTLADKISKQ